MTATLNILTYQPKKKASSTSCLSKILMPKQNVWEQKKKNSATLTDNAANGVSYVIKH